MTKVCIHNALVVSGTGVKPGGIVINDDGRIERVTGPSEEPASAQNVIDAGGKMLFPGFVDAHVHMRDPGAPQKENFMSGTEAAACGGVTTVMCMPNTNPPVTDLEGVSATLNAGNGKSYVDYCIQAALNKNNLNNIDALWGAGVTSFEVFLSDAPKDDLLEIEDYFEVAIAVERVGGILGVYTGSQKLLERRLTALRQARGQEAAFHELSKARHPFDEALGITAVTEICQHTRVKTVLRQTCTARGFAIARSAKQHDPTLPLAIEVTPHHLHLTNRIIEDFQGFAYMIPPLRSEEDCDAAVASIADQTVDFIGSDHAPHEARVKTAADPWTVPGGVPGLDTIVPAALDLAAKGLISYADVARVLCERPAMLFGLADRKGFLSPGNDGDVVLVDPKETREISPIDIRSKAGRSPFEGYRLRGRVVLSLLRGDVISKSGNLVATGPNGEFLTRGTDGWNHRDA